MKFKTIASTFFLSSFLVGGLATEAEALTLPEPTTHTVTTTYYTGYNLTGDWQNPVYPQITVTATFDGYYGEFEFDHSDFKGYYINEYVLDENGIRTDEILETSNVYVIAEGSTVKYTLSCPEAPEITVNPYLDGLADNHYQTEYIHMEWTAALGCMEYQLDDTKALTVFNQERYVYSYYKTDDGQYGFSPTLGLTRLVFPTGDNFDLHTDENGEISWWSNHIVNLDKVLTINQEKIDILEQNGEVCFETFFESFDLDSMDSEKKAYWENVQEGCIHKHTLSYTGLLELLGGESSEPTTPSTPESTSPVYASWAEPQVTIAEENNLIVDSLGNDYTKSITRTQIADLLVNMIEQHTGIIMAEASADTFTDSTSEAVLKAFDAGIISGKGEGIFDPEATATRQEIAIMIVNAIKVLEENTGESFVDHNLTSLDGYADFDTTADWAQNHVAILANNGIMSGSDGYLTPLSDTSIQECLVLNNNLFKLGE